MLKEERQQIILTLLHDSGKIVVSDLSRSLDISEDTIRRDLRDLDESGLLLRVHGGALPRSNTPPAYTTRAGQAAGIKESIAAATVKRLRHGQVILLDGGTTALRVAQQLPPDFRATVVTHSIPAMMALAAHPTVDVILLGGRLFKESLVAVGAQTVAALRSVRADVCILGVTAIHPDVGISASDYEEALVKQAMVACATEVIAQATADKLGKAEAFIAATVDQVTILVTEPSVPEDVLTAYRAHGITTVTDL